jgi:integrase/recombinase XerC
MLEQFVNYIQFEKRQSEHSVSAYRGDIIQFQDYLSIQYQVDHLHEASHSMIRSWVVELRKNALTNKSIHRKVSSLKAFYKFLRREGVVVQNPTARIVLPKIEKRLPEFLKKDEIGSLLEASYQMNDFVSLRNRLIILLFYQCGIRLSELVNLKEAYVENNSIRVIGKRNKERIVPLIPEVKELIEKYLVVKHESFKGEANSTYLIVKNDGNQSYPKFIYTIVNQQLTGHTTLKKKSPHVLRHTFATQMLDEGADLNSIKEMLGHANLTATQVYTHNSLAKIKSIYKQAHPRADKTK